MRIEFSQRAHPHPLEQSSNNREMPKGRELVDGIQRKFNTEILPRMQAEEKRLRPTDNLLDKRFPPR